jgi:hypothetical protein
MFCAGFHYFQAPSRLVPRREQEHGFPVISAFFYCSSRIMLLSPLTPLTFIKRVAQNARHPPGAPATLMTEKRQNIEFVAFSRQPLFCAATKV